MAILDLREWLTAVFCIARWAGRRVAWIRGRGSSGRWGFGMERGLRCWMGWRGGGGGGVAGGGRGSVKASGASGGGYGLTLDGGMIGNGDWLAVEKKFAGDAAAGWW